MTATSATTGTTNAALQAWVDEVAALTTPEKVVWITGSDEEIQGLNDELVAAGTFVKLDESKKPNSYWAASDPSDVARVEDRTFIASEKEEDAGFTNNWMAPAELKGIMTDLYKGCMTGRTMYVIPFVMGHLNADQPMYGVEITDSAYVVVSMKIMARIGEPVLRAMEEQQARRRERKKRDRKSSRRASSRACTRSATRSPTARPTSSGRAATPSTSRTSPRPARSGPTARATAATPCWARSAWRCASPRPWGATRAGWPSTCSSSSSPRRPARSTTSPAPSRARAARPISR